MATWQTERPADHISKNWMNVIMLRSETHYLLNGIKGSDISVDAAVVLRKKLFESSTKQATLCGRKSIVSPDIIVVRKVYAAGHTAEKLFESCLVGISAVCNRIRELR